MTDVSPTAWALRAAALFSVLVYALLPLGLGGTLGTQAVADDPTAWVPTDDGTRPLAPAL